MSQAMPPNHWDERPDNALIDAARGRDPRPPAETQADMLRRLAAAADKHGQHIYTHGRDSNAAKANEAWHRAASPELVIGLLDRIAELEAKQPAPGWKLVPETLTDEMKREFMDLLMDGIDIYVNRHDQIEIQTDSPRRIWKQVLSVVPEPKAQESS